MSAVLALLASLVWGGSDYLGGVISRRIRPVVVVAGAHAIALASLLLLAWLTNGFPDSPAYLPWAIAAGAIGFLGLLAFYRALATGTMGIVAPIAGTGAVVPVLFGFLRGDTPSRWQDAGIVVVLAGVVAAGGPELSGAGKGGKRPLVLALFSALSFGVVYVLIKGGSRHSVLMTLVAMRATSVAIVVLGSAAMVSARLGNRGRPRVAAGPLLGRRGWRDLLPIALVGWSDAGANGLYGLATQRGLVSVVAVLASLYPAVTVVLARIIDGERMRRIQDVGVGLALCGVVLIGVG